MATPLPPPTLGAGEAAPHLVRRMHFHERLNPHDGASIEKQREIRSASGHDEEYRIRTEGCGTCNLQWVHNDILCYHRQPLPRQLVGGVNPVASVQQIRWCAAIARFVYRYQNTRKFLLNGCIDGQRHSERLGDGLYLTELPTRCGALQISKDSQFLSSPTKRTCQAV